MEIETAYASDIGGRHRNEDSVMILRVSTTNVGRTRESVLMGVADGVGGGPGGDRASALALVTCFACFLRTYELSEDEKASVALKDAVHEANSEVRRQSNIITGLHGMASTLTICLLDGYSCHVAHVGDSRCYLIRDQSIRQITVDHSKGNRLLQSIGSERKLQVFSHTFRLRVGDKLLVCCDGLTNELNESKILKALNRKGSVHAKCADLIARAKAAGGDDNISVSLAEVKSF